MEKELNACLEDLITIKKYLIKKGQSRYQGNVIRNKLFETENIYEKSKELINVLSSQKNLTSEYVESLSLISKNIESYYLEIIDLCKETKEETSSKDRIELKVDKSNSDSNYCLGKSFIQTKMEFDLKTACDFIPVMSNNESNIKNIIDSIEMYSDMLTETGKQLLIKFVLKNRLNENAKLRLADNYTNTTELIRAMRHLLITKKSFTAIQTKLLNTTQGWRTIDQFGTEIEKLFTNLTISQADGDSSKYSTLKPLNEKTAIKQFAGGLRDSQLSTIILARNYSNLQEAIQAAKDEELSSATTSGNGEVMHFSRRGRGNVPFNNFQKPFNNNRIHQGSQRGNYRGGRSNYYGNDYKNSNQFNTGNFGTGNFYNNRGRFNNFRGYQSNYIRGNNSRGLYQNTNRGQGYQTSFENRSSYGTNSSGNRIFCTEEPNQSQPNDLESKELQFFRS